MSAVLAPVAESPATREVNAWLAAFGSALERGDAPAAAATFEEEGFWRDLVAFTWNIRTCEGRAEIRAMLDARLADVQPRHWQLDGEATASEGFVEGWIRFETAVARGYGHVRVRDGRCWTLLTTMAELKAFEEKSGARRAKGTHHGADRNRRTWLEQRQREEAELGVTRQPYCVIVGGGQGGIALAARLRRLDVPTIVVDRHERPGDAWRKRYKSLCLHDPVWYDHLPYLPFPDDWPVFTPKDKIADWLEMYVRVMEIPYWSGTECVGARYDDASATWNVTVRRGGRDIVLQPKQLVLATGASGFPSSPTFPGADTFEGVQVHSSAHAGGEGWEGKPCIVLGSNNSAHDIAADLWEHGADVTMIQRSSTLVARSDSLMEMALGALYSEEAVKGGITTDKADLIFASVPYRLLGPMQVPVYAAMAERDAAFYDRLRRAGFLLDMGEDGTGLFLKFLRRGSGYYIDVGASELVADGSIKLKSGVSLREIRPRSVVLTDGTELPADLIVYATGYGPMNQWAEKIISKEVAARVGRCWGLGSATAKDPGPWEGELRNMWKPTAQPGLWFHGGNLHMSRFHSKFLALQLKARMEGLSTPVWGAGPVHHAD
ncbi:MAG TPA: NAD(P)/FAD-dependent oxidoreductase [Nevskiaceae bacterium]|nr:NAD(P)/FAD-dependent oxidoreductase [Nevskiaceae bacterium]